MKTYGISKTGFLTGKACVTLTPTATAVSVDRTPNKDRNGFCSLFRTMLTNKQKQCWIYHVEKYDCSLGRKKEEKKRPQPPRSPKQPQSCAFNCSADFFFPCQHSMISLNLDIVWWQPTVVKGPICGYSLLTCHPQVPSFP